MGSLTSRVVTRPPGERKPRGVAYERCRDYDESMAATTVDATRLFRRILVPHDFSDHATRALALAASLAGPRGQLVVLHALAAVAPVIGAPMGEIAWTPPPETRKDVLRELTALVTGTLGRRAGIATCRVVLDDPVTAILAAARRVDSIVMTTMGRTGLAHLVMGSVAEKVVRQSPVPVLTLRPAVRARRAR